MEVTYGVATEILKEGSKKCSLTDYREDYFEKQVFRWTDRVDLATAFFYQYLRPVSWPRKF
jgi:hypothetical protein